MIFPFFLGICAAMPLFDMAGPSCLVLDQAIECRCSECFTWGAVNESLQGRPDWNDIERTNPDGSFGIVGSTWRVNWLDPEGVNTTDPPANVWCIGRDSTMPREGLLYTYRVRACNLIGCSGYSDPIDYVAAPYAVDAFQPPVLGNP